MPKNLSYFGYFLFAIMIVATLAKMMNFLIVTQESPKIDVEAKPQGVCSRDSECTPEVCDPSFDSNNPDKNLFSCVCEHSMCVWKLK